MSSPSGNPRKRRPSPSNISRVVKDKRPRVSDSVARENQSVSSPEAVSPTQSSQSLATAQTPNQKECSIDVILTQAKINLMNIKQQAENTLEILVPFMPVLHHVSKLSRGRQEGSKKPKRSSSFKETVQVASTKAVGKSMPASQNITKDHSVIQGAPPSLEGTEKELLNVLVRCDPRRIIHEKEKKIQGIILCFTILQKVGCNPIEFLEGMKGVTQVVGLGSHNSQPNRILYLNLEELDKYVFPFFMR